MNSWVLWFLLYSQSLKIDLVYKWFEIENELECCDKMIFSTLCIEIPYSDVRYLIFVVWSGIGCFNLFCDLVWDVFAYFVIWHWKTHYAWWNWWRLVVALRFLHTTATQQKSVVNTWVKELYKGVIKYAKWLCYMIYVMWYEECVPMQYELFMNDLKKMIISILSPRAQNDAKRSTSSKELVFFKKK